jgi:electron transfer flavoprotein beta subunit
LYKQSNNTAFDTAGIQWIINPWDELALTRALELKETTGGTIEKITVVAVGLKDAEPTLRKALAIGADDAVRMMLFLWLNS